MSSKLPSVSRLGMIQIAWPIIVSNLATPLLGLVDTAVIGNLGDPALIGAIAVGAMIFNFLYWGFGFLRMGTTGLVAQARGADDALEVRASLYRALLVGVAVGSLLVLMQVPIMHLALSAIDGSPAVESAAISYFSIRIWAAPISLAYFALIGFLLGCQETRLMLLLQVLLNGTNILLDLVFVVGLGWGVAGIAAATVIAEFIALAVAAVLIIRKIRSDYQGLTVPLRDVLNFSAVRRMLAVNRDIMIRTLSLIFGFAWFTNAGAAAGDLILAANAILMQFVSFAAFFLDGFALATESLIGYATGARRNRLTRQIIRHATILSVQTALALTLLIWLVGPWMISLLTNIPDVQRTAVSYLPWAAVAPLVSAPCYLLDGIFIGATRTREMRNAMLVSLLIYLSAWWLLSGLANHGLWLSLHCYYAARGLTLGYYLHRGQDASGSVR